MKLDPTVLADIVAEAMRIITQPLHERIVDLETRGAQQDARILELEAQAAAARVPADVG